MANGDAPRKAPSIADSPRGSNLARPPAPGPAHGMRDIPQTTLNQVGPSPPLFSNKTLRFIQRILFLVVVSRSDLGCWGTAAAFPECFAVLCGRGFQPSEILTVQLYCVHSALHMAVA